MSTSLLELLAFLPALISVAAAVVAVMIVRRGADADLKGDVNDLARLVERIAKDQRSDRMRRVRKGESMATPQGEIEIPPGAEAVPMAGAETGTGTAKDELRRRVMHLRGVR